MIGYLFIGVFCLTFMMLSLEANYSLQKGAKMNKKITFTCFGLWLLMMLFTLIMDKI